ncbi:hypothetical protein [Gellertiella hungarica]|uniref:Transmembrane protein n=1 Tax=Gellertiella hungarica TaxID=1572859 RepID=A0A7W6J675_9HYPH|nr:hypothetical protein [Gellertiella hungarica]MBB4065509.1 hypothetical protein [Gellertiella hungarica]
MKKLPLRLVLASTTFLALAGSAFALDGDEFLAAINKSYETSGTKVAATDIEVDGSDITMTGVSYTPPGEGAKPVTVGDVNFTGVEEDEDGNYTVENVTFPDISSTEKTTTVTATGLSLSGVFIPADPTQKTVDTLAPFESANSGKITVSENGKEVFSMESMEATATVREDESGVDYSWKAEGLKADLSQSPDPKTKDAVEKLGLQTLEGNIEIASSWALDKGTMAIDALTLDFKNVGKLNMSFSLSGMTLDLIQKIEDASKQMNDPATKDAANLQFMGLMQQLAFVGAEIRFEDASITKRALDYAGQQQGVTGQQLAESLKAMAPLMLAQLNVPELQNAVASAVSAYLDDPKSFTVSAKPSAPVAFPMIMGAAMGAPNTIPQMLSVKVSAND